VIKKIFDNLIDGLGYVMVRTSPVIGAFPAASTILQSTGYTVHSWILVGGVEFMGYAIGHVAVIMVRRKWVTWKQAMIPIGIYALMIEGLLLGYEVIPSIQAWQIGKESFAHATQAGVSMLLPFFTLAGAGLYAIHQKLTEVDDEESTDKIRVRSIDDAKAEIDLDIYRKNAELQLLIAQESAEVRNKIRLSKASKPDSGSDSENQKSDSGIKKVIDYDKIVIDHYRSNPLDNQRIAADTTGISQPKISKTLKDLESRGIIHRNGNGVEVFDNV